MPFFIFASAFLLRHSSSDWVDAFLSVYVLMGVLFILLLNNVLMCFLFWVCKNRSFCAYVSMGILGVPYLPYFVN